MFFLVDRAEVLHRHPLRRNAEHTSHAAVIAAVSCQSAMILSGSGRTGARCEASGIVPNG